MTTTLSAGRIVCSCCIPRSPVSGAADHAQHGHPDGCDLGVRRVDLTQTLSLIGGEGLEIIDGRQLIRARANHFFRALRLVRRRHRDDEASKWDIALELRRRSLCAARIEPSWTRRSCTAPVALMRSRADS
jgi:hypothetical protein